MKDTKVLKLRRNDTSMSVVEALLENDPDVDFVEIYLVTSNGSRWRKLTEERSDANLAKALLQNLFIRKVYLYICGTELDDWPLLQEAFVTHQELKKVVFVDESLHRHVFAENSMCHASRAVTSVALPFLKAAYRNASIETIAFEYFHFDLTSDLFSFLYKEYNGKRLQLFRCDMAESLLREQGGRMLGSSNIQDMEIRKCNDCFASHLVNNLGRNVSVERLKVELSEFDLVGELPNVAVDIVQFLRRTQSVRKFVLHIGYVNVKTRDKVKHELLQAVKHNFSLRSLVVRVRTGLWFGGVRAQQRLQFYANRNERLEEWVEDADLLPRELWGEALGLAQQSGTGALYQSLCNVLGRNYGRVGSPNKKNKRKFGEL